MNQALKTVIGTSQRDALNASFLDGKLQFSPSMRESLIGTEETP